EHVIDHLKCDLLVIKPENFNCPIETDEDDEHDDED
ncbi:TPA: universal stress protein UspE, partial [Serratia marcescens]|nr:universal stress protein UspE [Serratia marcescens]